MRNVYLQDKMPAYLNTKAKQGALLPSFVKLALEALAPVAGLKALSPSAISKQVPPCYWPARKARRRSGSATPHNRIPRRRRRSSARATVFA